jgi:hypothetical protein
VKSCERCIYYRFDVKTIKAPPKGSYGMIDNVPSPPVKDVITKVEWCIRYPASVSITLPYWCGEYKE